GPAADTHAALRLAVLGLSANRGLLAVPRGGRDACAVLGGTGSLQLAARGLSARGAARCDAPSAARVTLPRVRASAGFRAVLRRCDTHAVFGGATRLVLAGHGVCAIFVGSSRATTVLGVASA